MSEHTRGPWIARYADRVTRADDTDGTKSIAHIYGCLEQRANRNLIAAAPDMLAYCKLMAANGDPDAIELVSKAEGR